MGQPILRTKPMLSGGIPYSSRPPVESSVISDLQTDRRELTPKSPSYQVENLSLRKRSSSSLAASAQGISPVSEDCEHPVKRGSWSQSNMQCLRSLARSESLGSTHLPSSDTQQLRPERTGSATGSASTFTSTPVTGDESLANSTTSSGHLSQSVLDGTCDCCEGCHTASRLSIAHGINESQCGFRGPASDQPGDRFINTDTGTTIFLADIDLQKASKKSDEKRKYNAAASARFRARRKDKGKEMSHLIETLQRAVKDLTEERDFYLKERNLFCDYIADTIKHNQPHLKSLSSPTRSLPLPPSTFLLLESSTATGDSATAPREVRQNSPQRRRL